MQALGLVKIYKKKKFSLKFRVKKSLECEKMGLGRNFWGDRTKRTAGREGLVPLGIMRSE